MHEPKKSDFFFKFQLKWFKKPKLISFFFNGKANYIKNPKLTKHKL